MGLYLCRLAARAEKAWVPVVFGDRGCRRRCWLGTSVCRCPGLGGRVGGRCGFAGRSGRLLSWGRGRSRRMRVGWSRLGRWGRVVGIVCLGMSVLSCLRLGGSWLLRLLHWLRGACRCHHGPRVVAGCRMVVDGLVMAVWAHRRGRASWC